MVKHRNNNGSQGIPALGRLRQGDGEVKAGLGGLLTTCPLNEKKKKISQVPVITALWETGQWYQEFGPVVMCFPSIDETLCSIPNSEKRRREDSGS